jgi:hypothetical protein
MANICAFTLTVTGDCIQRRRFRVALETKVDRINKGPFGGEFVVYLPPEVWGRLEYHTLFWATPTPNSSNEFIQAVGDELIIKGESKWSPPLDFLAKASQMFPDLAFEISSTIEHELYEEWVAKDGKVDQIGEELVDNQTEEVLRLVEDGEVVIDKTAASRAAEAQHLGSNSG